MVSPRQFHLSQVTSADSVCGVQQSRCIRTTTPIVSLTSSIHRPRKTRWLERDRVMRIALVTREFPPDTSWGGIGTFYGHFAQALARAGCDVEVFCQSISAERIEQGVGYRVHHVLARCGVGGPKTGGATAGNNDLGLFA